MLGDDIAIHAFGFFGEPFQEGCAIGHFALGFRQGLALLAGHDQCQIVGIFVHQLVPAAQDRSTLFRQFLAPGGPGFISGFDRTTGFRRTHFRHGRNDFTSRGIGDVDCLTAVGIQPFAINIALLAQKAGIFQAQACGFNLIHRVHPYL